MMKRWFRKREK